MSELENSIENDPLHSLEPFPMPNACPQGWLLDAVPTPAVERKPASEPLPDWYERFSEPNAYPSGWSF